MRRNDWAGVFWILIGIYVVFHSWRLGVGRLNHPGPGFIFFLVSLFLVILGSIDLCGALIRNSKIRQEEPPLWAGLRWPKVLLVMAVLCAYVFFLNTLGFMFCTLFLMLILFKAIEPMKWWLAIAGSVITIMVSVGIFQVWLKVPFPKGFVGF